MDKDTQIIDQMALGLANQGKFKEAITYFKKSIEINPNGQNYYFLGLTYQKLNNLGEAEKSFRQALVMNKSMPQPYNGLGLINFQKGDYQKASQYYKLVLKYNPFDFAAYNNLGNVYKKMNKPKRAIGCYLKAIKIVPLKPEPYNNLGTVYFQSGDLEKSAKYLKKAIAVDPNYEMAYFHLGVLYRKLGLPDESKKYLLKHIDLNFNHAESYRILGGCYLDQNNLKAALDNFQKALQLNPNSAFTQNDLGNFYRKDHNSALAINYYQKALELDTSFAGAHSNLGIVFCNLGQTDLALKHLNQAISLDPNCFEAYYHLGLVNDKLNKTKQAIDAYRKALIINNSFYDALAALVSSLMQNCDWSKLAPYAKRLDTLTQDQIKKKQSVTEPALLNLARVMDEAQNLAVAKSWSDDIYSTAKSSGVDFKHTKSDKIKIGYLSCDYYNHATAHLMLGLFARHNREKFEIYVYSYGPDDKSEYRKKILKDADHFVDISSLSNIEAATRINKDKILILVDLKGYTRDTREEIVALKPAPINVAWLGFPGTSGSKYINYIIADRVVLPKESEAFYTEKPIYLPCYQVNDEDQPVSSQKYTRASFGLPAEGVVFASFNAAFKITPETYFSWMNILGKTKSSVLWLLIESQLTQKNLKDVAKSQGIDPKRIIFTKQLPKDKHLARLRLADLALDTFTYNGHTTTSDCLWAGVPVVTLKGHHFASRVSASLLTAIGLSELITKTSKEYEYLAVELATNPSKLTKLRTSLNANKAMSPLFDTKLFVKNLEEEFLKMWHNYTK